MELYQEKTVETIVIVVLYVIARSISSKLIRETTKSRNILSSRGVLINKVVSLVLTLLLTIFILLIWGVKQSELVVFLGSTLTIVGVAFFAQWSLLSNITSSVILFFNHPVRMNDHIVILEAKDYIIEGQVINIGVFFVTLKTPEGEEITLPNNIFIQKSIRKISDDASRASE